MRRPKVPSERWSIMQLKNDSEPLHVILQTRFYIHSGPVVSFQLQRTTTHLLVDRGEHIFLLMQECYVLFAYSQKWGSLGFRKTTLER